MTPTIILSAAAGTIAGVAAWREGRDLTAALIIAGLTSAAVFTMISVAEWLISTRDAADDILTGMVMAAMERTT